MSQEELQVGRGVGVCRWMDWGNVIRGEERQ